MNGESDVLKILIPNDKYQQIMSYVLSCDTEITGFADVVYEENKLIVGDVYLPEQSVTAGSVDVDEEVVSSFLLERIKAGAETMPRLWWHSHVNMDVFWSTTDMETIEKVLKNDQYSVSIVFNKKMEHRACVRIYSPIGITFNDIEVEVDQVSQEYMDRASKEILAKVSSTAYSLPYSNGSGGYVGGEQFIPLPRNLNKARKFIKKRGLKFIKSKYAGGLGYWTTHVGSLVEYYDPVSGRKL